jgi:hypothetical protein
MNTNTLKSAEVVLGQPSRLFDHGYYSAQQQLAYGRVLGIPQNLA